MDTVEPAESESESTSDGKADSSSEDEEMESVQRCCDVKKWIAVVQICVGFLLVVLEIANITVLNPWYRIFCPGIWMGVIFFATGGLSFAYYKLEHLQNKRLSITSYPSPPYRTRVFRIVFLVFCIFSVILSICMIVILGIVIDSLLSDLRSPTDTMFAMTIAMISLYSLMLLASAFAFILALRFQSVYSKASSKTELPLAVNDASTTLSV